MAIAASTPQRTGIAATIAIIAAVGGIILAFKWKSLVSLLSLGKLLPTLGSMFVFIWARWRAMAASKPSRSTVRPLARTASWVRSSGNP